LDALPLLIAWLLAVLIPGPDFVVVVRYATSRSRRHGALVAVGVSSATLLWATGSMLGLSVLLTRLSWLYETVRLAGAGYLVYLGVRTLRSSRRRAGSGPAGDPAASAAVESVPVEPGGLLRAWRVGFLTNAANPKAAAFFGSLLGALLPPHPSAGLRTGVIVAIAATALVWYLVVAGMFGAAPVARLYHRVRRWVDRVTATVLIVLGGRLALYR
jgi:threonine/homoserine/homoserine lactone efflux protein